MMGRETLLVGLDWWPVDPVGKIRVYSGLCIIGYNPVEHQSIIDWCFNNGINLAHVEEDEYTDYIDPLSSHFISSHLLVPETFYTKFKSLTVHGTRQQITTRYICLG